MKKLVRILLAAALLLTCLVPFAGAANYRSDLYRVNDFVGILSEEEVEALDEYAFEILDECAFDPVVCILYEEELDPEETELELSAWLYERNEFGWGPRRDGCLLLIVQEEDGEQRFTLSGYGRGEELLTRDALSVFNENFSASLALSTPAEAIHSALNEIWLIAADSAEEARDLAGTAGLEETDPFGSDIFPGGYESAKPDWYPADVNAFTDFHDAQAPRVVDNADIFTDAEEAAMLKKIGEIQKSGTDLVVFTDVSTYGLDRGTYAADFHHFNGYGFGDDYNGSVLFICMEPGNRGWWTAATGACRKLYTEKNVNAIDDKLEPYMIAGDYGEGVLGYLDNVSYLYEKGHMPIDPHIFIAPAVAAAVAGLLAAAIAVSIMQGKMKNIAGATEARSYLVPGTFDLLRREDYFLYSNVTRTRISSDSGRSSGGGSSFSGGYSSSGGRSYSGGGRSF